jgi:hypothetical protein
MTKQITITLTQEQYDILNSVMVYAQQKMINEVGYYATELDPFKEVKNEIKKQYQGQ